MSTPEGAAADDDRRAAPVWGALLLAATVLFLLVRLSERLPRVRAADAPATEFSATRAWVDVTHLSDSIGLRVTGTPGAERALAFLEMRLRAIPGLEVEVQDATGILARGSRAVGYRTKNLVARLPGASPEALLLSAHYDTPPESFGAADDAVGAAVVVETMRALAAGPRPPHTVIANINGAEEMGLLGAAGFLQHRWAGDVRAFIDLESAGAGGKAILFQGGPGNDWLTRAYAGGAPHPYGSVIAQDIFQSGAIPSSTDFEVYTARGLPGLDLALYRDGWAYHTALDRSWNVSPGSVQHMGDNALGISRALVAGPLPGDIGGRGGIYYDILGTTMVAYGARAAGLLAVVGIALTLVAVVVAAWRMSLSPLALLGGFGATVLAVVFALLLAAGAGMLPSAFGRPHGWFARPWLGVLAYGALALAAMLGVHALWARIGARFSEDRRAAATWAGGLLVWTIALALLTARGIGSAYLALWWTVPGALGLLVFTLSGGRRVTLASLMAFVPGALLAMQVADQLIATFVPIAGRMDLPIPFDPVIALLVAASVVMLAILPVAVLHRVGRFGRAATTALAIGIAGMVAVTLAFPYTPRRPKRIAVVHESSPGSTQIAVDNFDWIGSERAVLDAGLRSRVQAMTAGGPVMLRAEQVSRPAPDLRVVRERSTPDSVRAIDVVLTAPGAYAMTLSSRGDGLLGWSLGPGGRLLRARLVAAPDTGWALTLEVRPGDIVELTATAHYAEATPAADSVMRRLPPWTTSYAITRSTTTYRF